MSVPPPTKCHQAVKDGITKNQSLQAEMQQEVTLLLAAIPKASGANQDVLEIRLAAIKAALACMPSVLGALREVDRAANL